jgi:hypothetical protein
LVPLGGRPVLRLQRRPEKTDPIIVHRAVERMGSLERVTLLHSQELGHIYPHDTDHGPLILDDGSVVGGGTNTR